MSISMKYDPSISLSIGVNNYEIYLPDTRLLLRISFEISGDFLAAALRDDIEAAVNYDDLCQALKARVLKSSKEIVPATLAHELKDEIMAYSPKIRSGLLNIEMNYEHDAIKYECRF
jgi:dihydroneopterin aldolase